MPLGGIECEEFGKRKKRPGNQKPEVKMGKRERLFFTQGEEGKRGGEKSADFCIRKKRIEKRGKRQRGKCNGRGQPMQGAHWEGVNQ